jgi:GT2 family glycosyltransferase
VPWRNARSRTNGTLKSLNPQNISNGIPILTRYGEEAGMSALRIAVVIASRGRPLEVSYVLQALQAQTKPPSAIVLSVETASDIPPHESDVAVITGPSGLTRQRNRGMELVLADSDIIVFFDDDFLPTTTALAGIAALFQSDPRIVGASGLVLHDGVTSGGVPLDIASALLESFEAVPPAPIRNRNIRWAYGCNMAFRASSIGSIRFDENLPLYGWQEDVDFSTQIAKSGRVVKTNAFAGVHLGVHKSRSSGISLGYSQIVNPVYLVRKGTMSPAKAALLMARNLAANHFKAIAPEPWIDRRGRVRGNWRGIAHVLRGQIDPAAILKF